MGGWNGGGSMEGGHGSQGTSGYGYDGHMTGGGHGAYEGQSLPDPLLCL